MGASVLQVFVMRGGQLVASEMFAEGLYTLGSEPDCDLVLTDPQVSPLHASLQFQDGVAQLTDNDSAHGLIINGARVPSAQVKSSDDVRIGPFLIKTRVLGRKVAVSAPPPSVSAPPPVVSPSPAAVSSPPVVNPPAASPPPGAAPAAVAPRPPAAPAPRPPPPPPRQTSIPPTPLAALSPQPPRPGPVSIPPAPRAAVSAPPPAPGPPRPSFPPRTSGPQLRAVPPPVGPPTRPAGPPATAAAPAAARAPVQARGPGGTGAAPVLAPPPAAAVPPAPPPPARFDPPAAAMAATAPANPLEGARTLTGDDLLEDIDFLFDQALEQHATEAEKGARGLRKPRPQAIPLPAPAPRAPAPPTATAAPLPAPPVPRVPPAPPAPPAPRAREVADPLPLAAAAPEASRAARATVAGAVAGGALQAAGGTTLHARIFWGDTMLIARTFEAGQPAFTATSGFDLLQTYGFAPAPGGALVREAGVAWTIAPPSGVEAFERSTQGWVHADPSSAKELRLSSGGAVRLTRGRFQLELSVRAPPTKAKATLFKDMDWGTLLLVIGIAVGLVSFIKFLPPAPLQQPQEKEIIRQVQLKIEEKKVEPPKPKRPQPVEAQVVETPRPPSIAQATTLKAAGAPLKSLEKITKATRGIANLLATLDAAGAKGGTRSKMALLPSIGKAPAPLPGMGGYGACCAIGPITKGAEQLRSGGGTEYGSLKGASAGQGGVGGIPVGLPVRQAKVQGTYDRDAVGKVINEHVNEIRSCYERALLRDPNLGAGKVLLEWTIGLGGGVTKVGAKVVTIKSNEVVSCLLDTVRAMTFPKPTGGEVIVSYPVLFNAVGY